MPSKHHKSHRHKYKQASKPRNHRHHKKEQHESLNQLDPIEEVSKEIVRTDKNACGDYYLGSHFEENETKKSSKRKRNRSDNIDKQKEKRNHHFEKGYTKVREEIKKPKSIRHQSLEKNEESLLERTKLLFRKEKSFNDAVKKVNDLEKDTVNRQFFKEVRNKHVHKEIKGKVNVPPEKENNFKEIESRRRSERHSSRVRTERSKKKHRSPHLDMYSRVQEVIFCQMNQVPYKMKNDKNPSEIKDLYHRRKIDRKCNEQKDVPPSQIPQENNLNRRDNHLIRVKSADINNYQDSSLRSENSLRKHHVELSKNKHCSERAKGIPGQIGPASYEKYFTLEGKQRNEKKITKCLKDKQEKKHQAETESKRRKSSHEKPDVGLQQAELEGKKIQEIVEGNFKNYFCKIQTMIDNKLEAIFQNNKRLFEERKIEKEKLRNRKRSKSDKKVDKLLEKQEKLNCFDRKEEIINEVLNRLKRKETRKLEIREKNRKLFPETVEKHNKNYDHMTFDNLPESKVYSPKESLRGRNIDKDIVEHHVQNNSHQHKLDRSHQLHIESSSKMRDSLEYIRNRFMPQPDLVEDFGSATEKLKERSRSLTKSEFSSEHNAKEIVISNQEKDNMILFQRYPHINIPVQRKSDIPRKHKKKVYSNNLDREVVEPTTVFSKREPDSFGEYLQHAKKGPELALHLEEIALTPEDFKQPTDILRKADTARNLPKPEFIVQGIEPPILQCLKKKSARVSKLECKTVSVIGILPKIREVNLRVVDETQTSSKSHKTSVADRDLVEKRKKLKHFKLDSVQQAHRANNGVRSIAGDSQRITTDPSVEELVTTHNKEKLNSELHQIRPNRKQLLNTNVVKVHDADTLHSKQEQDYFVPVRATHRDQYYCRSLKSSHCFKIEKKPATSYISVRSKETCEGKWVFCKGAKSRYHRSKSDIDLVPKVKGHCVLKSNSDVFLNGGKGIQEIRSMFLKDRERYYSQKYKEFSKVQECLNKKSLIATSCKECQTDEILTNETSANSFKNITTNTQQQFQEIYNTIDTLEKNICNVKESPQDTVDAAVSLIVLGDQCGATFKTIEDTISRNEPIKKIDAAVGSPRSSRQSARIKRILPTRHIQDVAVGDSETKLSVKTPKLKYNNRSHSKDDKHLRTSAVSQIRTKHSITQDINESLQKDVLTPKTPNPKQFLTVQKRSKQTPEASPMRTPTPIHLEPRKQRTADSSAARSRLQRAAVDVSCLPRPVTKQNTLTTCHPKISNPISAIGNLGSSNNVNNRINSAEPVSKTSPEFSCFHDCLQKRPKSSKLPATNTEPIMANPATCNSQANNIKRISSLTSSVSDAISQAAGTSDSVIEFNDNLSRPIYGIYAVQKAIQVDKRDREGSVISDNMEKFANVPNLRRAGTAIDQYVGSKFASRLFLTKDFKGRKISAYQRRKLYDQSLRQQMKKNVRLPKMNVGPQIFEVRFLSMVNQEEQRQKENNHITINHMRNPLISINLGRIVDENRVSGQDDAVTIEETNSLNARVLVDQLMIKTDTVMDKNRNVPNDKIFTFKEKKSTETEEKVRQNIACTCNNFPNILSLIETLNSVLAKYCSSEINIKHSDLEKIIACTQNSGVVTKVSAATALEPTAPDSQNKTVEIEEIFSASCKKVSSDSGQTSLEVAGDADSPILIEPLSCPTLLTHSTSFEFLYEESSSSNGEVDSRDAILANLSRPFNHQTFTLNNVETPFLHTRNYRSATASIESGYASIKSKTCCANSLSNFFKKPNIAALLKPAVLVNGEQKLSDGKNMFYEEMARSCQLYAKKVRQIKSNENNGAGYREFSLQVLLGKNSSIVLQSEALGGDDLKGDNQNADEVDLILEPGCKLPDTDSIQEDTILVSSKGSILSYSQSGCKIILNNEHLRIESFVYLGPEIFINDEAPTDVKESMNNVDILNLRREESSITFDFSMESVFNNNSQTQIFFTSLIQIYEKETEICNKLYEDDDFENFLLAAVKERAKEGKKNKKRKFCKLFGKKFREAERDIQKTKGDAQIDLEKKASLRLQTLASEAKKYFKMLADAVKVNENIDKEVKICGLLKLLERIESGDFHIMENNGRVNLEEDIRCQVMQAFISVHELCRKDAKKYKRHITGVELKLIKMFVIKYRICLLSESDIIARYISRGIIQTEDQLKAAVTFLIRSKSEEVDIKAFDEYCKFPK